MHSSISSLFPLINLILSESNNGLFLRTFRSLFDVNLTTIIARRFLFSPDEGGTILLPWKLFQVFYIVVSKLFFNLCWFQTVIMARLFFFYWVQSALTKHLRLDWIWNTRKLRRYRNATHLNNSGVGCNLVFSYINTMLCIMESFPFSIEKERRFRFLEKKKIFNKN